jgi:hypothetical protein
MTEYLADHARLLKSKQDGTPIDPVNVNEPFPGWYRGNAVKDGPLVPIIILRSEGDFGPYNRAFLGGREVSIDRVWPYCARNPISKEWHDAYQQNGSWPDVYQDIADSSVGHNNPPTDPAEVLKDQIEAAVQAGEVYLQEPLDNDLDAACAQTARSRLLDLAKYADTARKAEKEPHLAAGRAVDDKWMPLHNKAKTGADAIRKALSDYATASAAKVEAMGVKPAEKAIIKGGAGRAASVTNTIVVDEVTDWPALILSMQANEELRELVLKLANKAVSVGATVPGVTTKTVRTVR